jgi:hypothetical protein
VAYLGQSQGDSSGRGFSCGCGYSIIFEDGDGRGPAVMVSRSIRANIGQMDAGGTRENIMKERLVPSLQVESEGAEFAATS